MRVPVARARLPQVVEIVEHGKLHVRLDPVDQGHLAAGEGEDHRVLVGHSVSSEQAARRCVETEASPFPSEDVTADPPRLPTVRGGQVRVGHHQLRVPMARHPLHAGVLEGVGAITATGCQQVREVVDAAVRRGEDQDVRHVVDKARVRSVPLSVAVSHPSGEQVKHAFVPQDTGIEHRPVAGHRVSIHDRLVAQAADDGVARRDGTSLHGISCPADAEDDRRYNVAIGRSPHLFTVDCNGS
jgi:hypothetical protein